MTAPPMSAKHLVRAKRAYLDEDRANYTSEFVELPPPAPHPGLTPPIRAWRNRDFLAQLFTEGAQLRLTVNRAYVANSGEWSDGITWDELMAVKTGCGFGDRWAVEVFPPDDQVVNVANMRHLWLVDRPTFAWTPPATQEAS